MASHAPDYVRASALPLSAILASIPTYPRPVIERLVSRMIEHLDREDGDPDLEEDDDGGTDIDSGERDEAEYGLPVRQENLPVVRRLRRS